MGYSPCINKGENLLNSFKKLNKKWVPQTCHWVRATYLALVLLKTYYNKYLLQQMFTVTNVYYNICLL